MRFPAEGKLGEGEVRVDTGVREGDEISMFYDPMIAKLITHGKDRAAAIDTHVKALERLEIAGIQDNSPFLAAVLDQKRFQSGKITTGYIKEEFPNGFSGADASPEVEKMIVAASAYVHALTVTRAAQISGRAEPAKGLRQDWVVLVGRKHIPIKLKYAMGEAEVTFVDSGKMSSISTGWTPGKAMMTGTFDNKTFALSVGYTDEGYVLKRLGVEARTVVCSPALADMHARLPEKVKPDTSKLIMSPMPGLVVSVSVAVGQEVKTGEAVCIVEAMKMQNIIRAEADGVVKAVNASAGASVAADEVLVEFA
jgi:propionyl-CoA carboxylase alpha chain